MVAKDVAICVHRNSSRQDPGNKPNTVESVEATSSYEPEETVRCLRNREHVRGGRGPVLYSPGGMHVLGETFVRIEGVSRGSHLKKAEETRAQ